MKYAKVVQVVLAMAKRHGYVLTRTQILEQGVQPRQLIELIQAGLLVRIHPGVYAIAAKAAEPIVAIRATVVYAGSGALASHHSAAWLQDLLDSPGPLAHVTMTGRHHRDYTGIRIHRSERAPALAYRGIWCTMPARTIVDIAPHLAVAELNEVVDRALTKGLTRPSDLAREAESRRRGCGLLRNSLRELGHIGAPDASVLEAMLRRLVTRYGLPAPEVQVNAGPDGCYRVDSAWTAKRVVAELYGYAWHHSPEQMAHDSRRQRALTLEGWQVLVFTWRDVFCDPDQVAQDLRRALEEWRIPAAG